MSSKGGRHLGSEWHLKGKDFALAAVSKGYEMTAYAAAKSSGSMMGLLASSEPTTGHCPALRSLTCQLEGWGASGESNSKGVRLI